MNYTTEFLLNKYKELKCLADKENGKVFLVMEEGTNQLYVKKQFSGEMDISIYEHIKDKTYKNVPCVKAVFKDDRYKYVIEEYIQGGNLREKLEQHGTFSEKQVLKWMMELCDVLNQFHSESPPIIHRDITPNNIILTVDNVVKVIDFGNSRKYKKDGTKDTTHIGTIHYAAPEQYGYAQTDGRTDIYAIGSLMKTLLGGNEEADIDTINACKPLKRIIKKCMQIDAAKRYSNVNVLKRVLKHCFHRKARTIKALLIMAAAVIVVIAFTRAIILNTEYAKLTERGLLFNANHADSIFLDSYKMMIKGKMVEMAVDLNNDGVEETFLMSRDTPNGIKLNAVSRGYGMNFSYDEWMGDISIAFGDFGDLLDGYFAQIVCCDVDGDGEKEVMVSIGDLLTQNVTAIYEFNPDAENFEQFFCSGWIVGQNHIYFEEGKFIVPYGGQGLYDTYVYDEQNGVKMVDDQTQVR